MTDELLLETLFAGELSPVAAATEDAFHREWLTIRQASPLALAVEGGARADRLAWVFAAGYQAAIRAALPDREFAGWTAFVATEPKGAPPCQLSETTDGFELNGGKSWVAGVDHLRSLVVTCIRETPSEGADAPERQLVVIDALRSGVTLRNPGEATFLSELSQGSAAFSRVSVAEADRVTEPRAVARFRSAELLHVLAALVAFVAAPSARLERPVSKDSVLAVLDPIKALVANLDDRARMKDGLAELRTGARAVVDEFRTAVLPHGDTVLATSWRNDARLLKMFGVA